MSEYRIPRLALEWLLLTQSFLLLPHMLRFPVLVIPVWLFCTFWRLRIHQGRWRYPPFWVKLVLVVSAFVLIKLTQQRMLSVEATVCTLLLAAMFKLLEMKSRRDLLISVYLAYFVIVTELLFSQTLLSTLYMLAGVVMVTATLIAVHSNGEAVQRSYPLAQSLRMLAFSLPMMAVIFIVFPRLGPLWLVPKPAGQGKTGVSGEMSPGQFTELVKSDELAFRVSFSGDIPPLSSLYWRGVVLTNFDGRTWRPLTETYRDQPPLDDYQLTGQPPVAYHIIMEPSQRSWLFTLSGTVNSDEGNLLYARDFTVKAPAVIDQRMNWSLQAYPDANKGLEIYRYQRNATLRLPDGYNPQTQQLAYNLYQQVDDDKAYIRKVLAYFREQPFYYTLTPEALGRDSVDDFLFRSRRGFCEHYASAFVVLMREMGIPARVIAGYQGGDINPYEKHVSVRQMDAHAWAEVWLKGEGWVRFDPTYAVAPERIEQGSQQALQQQEGFLDDAPFSPRRFSGLRWLRSLGYRYDQLNLLWHEWVLNYQGRQQQNLLQALLGEVSVRRLVMLVGLAFVASALLVAGFFAWQYRLPALPPVEKIYRRFTRKLARRGLAKGEAEGPLHLRQRAVNRWPEQQAEIDTIIKYYLQLHYARALPAQRHRRLLKQFRHDVMQFKPGKKSSL